MASSGGFPSRDCRVPQRRMKSLLSFDELRNMVGTALQLGGLQALLINGSMGLQFALKRQSLTVRGVQGGSC